MDCSSLAPLSMGFSKQENWNGLPYLTPGDLLGSGMEPTSPALAGEFFTAISTWEEILGIEAV